MEEKKNDVGLVNSPAPNTQGWQSSLIEKLRSISLTKSSDEVICSKSSRSQHDSETSACQRASQTLWDTGKLAEPVPDGFYFVNPERRFKELFDTIPSLDELHALEADGLRPNVIVVDTCKDKKLSMLKQLAVTLMRGHKSNPPSIVKKIAGLVCDFFKRPKSELDFVKGGLEEVSHALGNHGIQMLGQIKHGSCHSRALLFKVLADTVGLESRLMVGLPGGIMERTDSYKHMSVIVALNSVEFLVDLMRNAGKLIPCSDKAIFLTHFSAESESAENDSYGSPVEPNSPLCDFRGQVEDDGLSHSEPNVANSFWHRSQKKVIAEERTDSSSPEHPFFRGHGRSLLGGRRHSFREYANDTNESRSAGTSPTQAGRRNRRCISMIPEIGDDIVRTVREMNKSRKGSPFPEEKVDSSPRCSTSGKDDCSDPQGSVSRFSPDDQGVYGQKPSAHNFHLKRINYHRAMSLPSSPKHFANHSSLRGEESEFFASPEMIAKFNRVLETSNIPNKPLLPFEEWRIDFSEIAIGARVGIGFFGEVFRGTWNGLDVGVKVFLEQDLTVENIEDFCNEVSILSRIRHPNVILFLGACTKPPRLSLVTEYMDMGSLYYLIHASGLKKKLSWQRRLKILCDICRGLMCIHRMKIAHRDIKSANCLVSKHWTVKICDFGLSRILNCEPLNGSSSAGTPEWMAPELIRNEPFTEKCDIFSLGVIIWELCTLGRPWEGVPAVQVVYAVGNDGQRLKIPDCPLSKLIADCWAESPDERPNCQEILSRLQECEISQD